MVAHGPYHVVDEGQDVLCLPCVRGHAWHRLAKKLQHHEDARVIRLARVGRLHGAQPACGRSTASAQDGGGGPPACTARTWDPPAREVDERPDGGVLGVVLVLPPPTHFLVHKERHAMRRRAVRTLGQVERRNDHPRDVDLRPPMSGARACARGRHGVGAGFENRSATRTLLLRAPAVRRRSRRSARRSGQRARAETPGRSLGHCGRGTPPPPRRQASLRTVAPRTRPSKFGQARQTGSERAARCGRCSTERARDRGLHKHRTGPFVCARVALGVARPRAHGHQLTAELRLRRPSPCAPAGRARLSSTCARVPCARARYAAQYSSTRRRALGGGQHRVRPIRAATSRARLNRKSKPTH